MIQLDDRARCTHASEKQRWAPGDHVGFAGELAGQVNDDCGSDSVRAPDDLDLSFSDDEKRDVPVARVDQHVASLGRAGAAVRRNARDLRRRQRRKHLIGAGQPGRKR